MKTAGPRLFRVLLRFRRIRRWREGLHRDLSGLGAPASDEKLWREFRRDLKRVPFRGPMHRPVYGFGGFARNFLKIPLKIPRVRFKTAVVRFRLRAVKPVKPARKFIITVTGEPASVAAAERCIESAKRFGEDDGLEIFPGVERRQARDFFVRHGLTQGRLLRPSDPAAVAGCFASHYKLWLRCIESGEPIIVLEHDAVFRAPLPPLRFRHVITLSVNPDKAFINPASLRFFRALEKFEGREVFHFWRYLPGTCGYAIKPEGARKLVDAASRRFVPAADVFMNKRNVNLLYYHPSPVVVDSRFSLVGE